MEIKAMHVHQIDGISPQSFCDQPLMSMLPSQAFVVVERSASGRRRYQPAAYPRPLGCDHDRFVTRFGKGIVEKCQNLFGAADRIRTNWCEGVGNAKNCLAHVGPQPIPLHFGCHGIGSAIAACTVRMADARYGKVVVIGELFVDEILSEFPNLPKLGEESFARKFRREIGGGAAITACGLAKLGVSVTVVGVVGKEDGSWVLKRLAACGVDASGVELHPGEPTGLTVSVSTREDRAFFSYYGANEWLPQTFRKPAAIDIMLRAQHVHFACAPDSQMDAVLFRKLRRRRCRISIDVQSHMSWLTKTENLELLRYCDIFFPNEREAEWTSGKTGTSSILRSLRDKGVRGVALKLGGKGAALLWDKREFLTDGLAVETLDTTGAGDCFDAGFIYAWMRGDPPERCLYVANICGALATRELGGIAGFPSLVEIQNLETEKAKRYA
jgi:ribokinase